MSAAQMQKETPEVAWPGLEALGLSQRELVLAEALQMEYDALSRLRQDKSETETVHSPDCSSSPSPGGECLSGPSPSPNQLGGADSPPSVPPRLPPPAGDTRQSLFILDASEDNKGKDSKSSDLLGSTSNPLPEESPPALPPRVPISQWWRSETPTLSPEPPNVNLFLSDEEQPKDYDSINQALVRLNSSQGSKGGPSGKPVTRSRTLPPQVPPRTHLPSLKCHKSPQQVPADLVRA